jgi:tripeptide aminopeptidase
VTAAQPAYGASELERRHLNGIFVELCRIESPSGRERACAELVIRELSALDVEAHEDDAAELTDSDCGNLHALVSAGGATLAEREAERAGAAEGLAEPEAQGARAGEGLAERPSLLLCAHLDTVPLQAPIEPLLVEGHWENANAGILGADNKAAVAVLLALARRVRLAGAPVDLELLFTVGEETALAGARVFDASRLRSPFGYVFDHASPIGEVVMSSPSHYRLEAVFQGVAAHAGIRPEDGRNAIVAAAHAITAMPNGRLDDETTVNVGTIAGGSAMNVVAELCTVVAEVRSIDDERARTVVAELVDRVHEAANLPGCDVDVDVSVERSFAGFRLSPSMPAVKLAESSLDACGFRPERISSGGASDANALLAQGFQMVNLANGTERNHEPGERVSVAALEQMLDVALTLLHESAALSR